MSKIYWHIHHDVLCEPLTEPLRKRKDYIRENKPKEEVVYRLAIIKPVKGNLPPEVDKAWAARDEASAAYDEASAAYGKAWAARDEALAACSKELQALHDQQCDCKWDGKTIFGRGWKRYQPAPSKKKER